MTWQQVMCVMMAFMIHCVLVVCGFEAFINGKHIIGEVKEKEQAHREYKQAISEGHGAYLMDEETPVSGMKYELTTFCTDKDILVLYVFV